TGLVYLPVNEAGFAYIPDPGFRPTSLSFNVGVDFNAGSLPTDPAVVEQIKAGVKGHLAAWDPVNQKEAWRVQYEHPWSGGALATAGNLVFAGHGLGEIAAYRADTGEKLWSAPTQAGVVAAPISYELDGEQYLAVVVGWGGALGLAAGPLARDAHVPSNIP